MCIIAAKPAGIPMIDDEVIDNMWSRNKDGAGFMYVSNGQVQIEKGFMHLKDLKAALSRVAKVHDLTKSPVVLHFRIATSGGVKPENTHPFPISGSLGKLNKLHSSARVAVAHNGVIDITPREGISDTMEYVLSQLAPLSRAVPKFYKNADLMLMIRNATGSKLAFLTGKGGLYTVGDFIEDNGVLYSNGSYKGWSEYTYNSKAWEWDDDLGACSFSKLYSPTREDTDYCVRRLQWLDESLGDFVMDDSGKLLDGDDFAIDEHGDVYRYSYNLDACVRAVGCTAYSGGGVPLRFEENADSFILDEIVCLGMDSYLVDDAD